MKKFEILAVVRRDPSKHIQYITWRLEYESTALSECISIFRWSLDFYALYLLHPCSEFSQNLIAHRWL